MLEVKIIKEGYFRGKSSLMSASSNVVLIKGKRNIIVDTGGMGEGKRIISGLKEEGLKPEDIDLVINTHCHLVHVWNNYLFEEAEFLVGGVKYSGDSFEIIKYP